MSVRRRKQRKTNWRGILSIVVLVLVLIIISRWVYHTRETFVQGRAVLEQEQLKLERLQERLVQVQTRNEYLETDTGSRDFLVERRGLIAEGERVLILVEDKKRASVVETVESEASWWGRLFKSQ